MQRIRKMISSVTGILEFIMLLIHFFILAALFFLTYEEIKTIMQPRISANYYTPLHMGAATMAEMVFDNYYFFCE